MNTQSGFHVTLRTDAAPLGRPATFQLTLPFPGAQTRNWRDPLILYLDAQAKEVA